jgi:hypothetical protein
MPRIRTIKPEFWSDYQLARQLTRDQRLFYVGLWNEADDEGRFQAHPVRLRGALFPYDEDIHGGFIEDSLRALAQAGKLVLYEVNGEPYGELVNFTKHQKINRPSPSRIPAPPNDLEHPYGPFSEGSVSDHGGLSEDSCTEGKGKEREREAPLTPKRKRALPLDWEPNHSHTERAEKEGVDLEREAEKFRVHARANGRKQLDWNAAFTQWLMRASEYQANNGGKPNGHTQEPTTYTQADLAGRQW